MSTTVHERLENEGEKRGMLAIQKHREEVTLALQNRPGFDIATISEEEFEQGLQRLELRQKRMQKIIATALIEDVHYGNPKDKNGRGAFKKPMLYQAGAEELMSLWRLTPGMAQDPILDASEAFVSATVVIAIHDSMGRVLAVRSGTCNTLEKRFKRNDDKGFLYNDAREMLHNVIAMAEKRAISFAVRAATGATAFFAAEEEMDKALAEPEEEEKRTPWTADERKLVQRAAVQMGMKTGPELKTFIVQTLGRPFVATGDDVATLLEALKRRPVPGVGNGEYETPEVAKAPVTQGDAFEEPTDAGD